MRRKRRERKYKNARARVPRNSDDGGVTLARAKRFLTIGIYGVRVDYPTLEGSGNSAVMRRREAGVGGVYFASAGT